MNWHERGDELEAQCRSWFQRRWPGGCAIIETKKNSIHGIDFAVETVHGDVFIVEVKSATGSLSDGQFTLEWISSRVGDDLYNAICRATLRRRYIIREVVRVREIRDGGWDFRAASPTGRVTWEELFPGQELPGLDMLSMRAHEERDKITIEHQMSGFGIRHLHRYAISIEKLSLGLRSVVLTEATFPFVVPHSHTVFEGGEIIYHRDLDDWDLHVASREGKSSGSVVEMACSSCGTSFYGFQTEQFCYDCYGRKTRSAYAEKISLVQEAERIAGSTDWKNAGEAQKELMARWKSAGTAGRENDDPLWERFQQARQKFFDHRTKHFEDQERAREANRQAKERLVAEAEALANSSEWKDVGEAQKELMDRWKAVGPAGRDHDDALWSGFQAARQKFFDRRTKHFEEQERAREANRQAKRRLITEAEALSDSTDWKGAGEVYKELMDRWKATGPAGRDHEGALWEGFQAARQRFFDRRTRHFENQEREREVNRQVKQRLVEEAAALSNSTDWKNAGQVQKELMDRWKATGPAGRDHDDVLWQKFQHARQRFFDQRTRHFDEQERAREVNRREKEGLVAEARDLSNSNDWKSAGQAQKELMDRWKAIGSAGRDHDDALWAKFQAKRQRFFDRRTRHFEQQEQARDANRDAKERLIRQAESLSSSTDWKGTGDELRDLMDQWKSIGPAGRDYDDSLWQRFQSARQEFYDNRTAYFEERDRSRQNRR